MTAPLLLIAEREFRAYVSTASFWAALTVGPLVIAGAVVLAALAAPVAGPPGVSIEAPTPALYAEAAAALREAAALEGSSLQVLPRGDLHGAARLTVGEPVGRDGAPSFVGAVPLSAGARLLVVRTLERDAALARLGEAPPQTAQPKPPRAAVSAPAVMRFGLVMMLWLTLTGSLGMLLQAVVRERANRALESLLAAAGPADVVAGKVLGVGAVSLLVLGAWLAAGALLAPLAPKAGGFGAAVSASLGDPVSLARAAVIYVLAFTFYGLVTVALGAGARDTAQAQNLSRPMFAVLLAAFFAAMAGAVGGGATLAWLVYLPPFTPFMLLLAPPGSLGLASQAIALGLMALASLAAGGIAIRRLDLTPAPARWRAA